MTSEVEPVADRLTGQWLPHVRRLLALLASFANTAIPADLFRADVLVRTPLFRTLHPPLDPVRLAGLFSLVEELAMIERQDGLHPTLSLAGPGREAGAATLASDHKLALAARVGVVSLLDAATYENDPGKSGSWPWWRLLVPHLLRCLKTADAPHLTLAPVPLERLIAAANDTVRAARYAETTHSVDELLRLARVVATRMLGEENAETISARVHLGQVLRTEDRLDDAVEEYRAAAGAAMHVFGVDHGDTVAVRSSLAHLLDEMGRYGEAEIEYRTVLAAAIGVYGPDHARTINTRAQLAQALSRLGRGDEAEYEWQSTIATAVRALGPDHRQVIVARTKLALLLHSRGRQGEAEREAALAANAASRIYGPDHPDTRAARRALQSVRSSF